MCLCMCVWCDESHPGVFCVFEAYDTSTNDGGMVDDYQSSQDKTMRGFTYEVVWPPETKKSQEGGCAPQILSGLSSCSTLHRTNREWGHSKSVGPKYSLKTIY